MARAQQDLDSRLRELVESHLGFVAKVAHALRQRAVPFEDLMSEGNLGLIEAARRFDRERGAGFLTYAVWWIRKRMLAAIASQQSLVRMSDHQARKIALREKAQAEAVADACSRSPRASRGTAAIRRIHAIRAGRPADLSLDHGGGADVETPLARLLADRSIGTPEEILLRGEAESVVRHLLCGLPQRHREILKLRFGFDGVDPTTLEQAGERVGLTRERVRQIERQSLQRIRRRLEAGWSGVPHGGAKGRAPEPPSVSRIGADTTLRSRSSRDNGSPRLPRAPGEIVSTA